MTVKELIEKLQKMPQDLEVLYSEGRHLSYHVGGIENVEVLDNDNKELVIIGDFDWGV